MRLSFIEQQLTQYDKTKSFKLRLRESNSVKKLKKFYQSRIPVQDNRGLELSRDDSYYFNRDILWNKKYDSKDARAVLFNALQKRQAAEWGVAGDLFDFMHTFKASMFFSLRNFIYLKDHGSLFCVAFQDIFLNINARDQIQENLTILMEFPDSMVSLAAFLKLVCYRTPHYYIEKLIQDPVALENMTACLRFFEVTYLTREDADSLLSHKALFKTTNGLAEFNHSFFPEKSKKAWFGQMGSKGLIEYLEKMNSQFEIEAQIQKEAKKMSLPSQALKACSESSGSGLTKTKNVRFFAEQLPHEAECSPAPLTEAERADCHFF